MMFRIIFLLGVVVFSAGAIAENDPYKPLSPAWVLHSPNQTENGGALVLVGVKHVIGKQDDPQLDDIKRIYNKFSPTLVLTEGGIWPVKDNKFDAVKCCGEMGYITYLASIDGVKVDTWEGSSELEAADLLEKFTKEELKIYYALRYIPQLMVNSELNAENKLNDILRKDGNIEVEFKINTAPYTAKELNLWLSKKHGNLISWKDFQVFEETITLDGLNQLVEIRKAVNELRDKAGAEKLNKYVSEGNRVIMIVGKDHFRSIMDSIP